MEKYEKFVNQLKALVESSEDGNIKVEEIEKIIAPKEELTAEEQMLQAMLSDLKGGK